MKILNRILAISAILAAPNAFPGVPVTSFRCDSPARDWRHSSLTGNGTLGAMVEGHVADEVIHLSHSRIYMPMDPELDNGARDPFMAACDLKISTDIDSWSDYRRRTIFRTGEVIVDAKDGEGRLYRRHVFASRPDGVIAIKIDDAAEREVFFALDALPISGFREARIFETGVRRFEVGKRDGFLFYRCEFSNRNPWNDLAGYVVALAAGADKTEAFIAIEPVPKGGFANDPFPAIRKRLGAAVAEGYEKLRTRHTATSRDLFGRVSFELDCDDPRIANRFGAARYNIISSTGGDNVPNLQGLWTGSWNEPWGSIFKKNGHLPCATSFFSRGNTPEFNECLAKWVERKMKDPRVGWHRSSWMIPDRLRDAYLHTMDEAWLKRIEPLVDDAAPRPSPEGSSLETVFELLCDYAPAEVLTNAAVAQAVRDFIDDKLENDPCMKAFECVCYGLAACKLGDAERAERCLARVTDGYWTKGGGTMHREADVFNMDLSGGYPYLVSEMLVHDEDGWARFMPAKPASWRKGSIKGLLLRGAVILEDLSWDGDSWKAVLRFKDGTVRSIGNEDAPLGIVSYDKLK